MLTFVLLALLFWKPVLYGIRAYKARKDALNYDAYISQIKDYFIKLSELVLPN